MIPRGPFQPLTFCDSVTRRVAVLVSLHTLCFSLSVTSGMERVASLLVAPCFVLRNDPVPPGWGPAVAPFYWQQNGSDATGRAPGREGVTRAMPNHACRFKIEGKRFPLLLGQSRTCEGASKSQGGWRGRVRDCKRMGSGGIAGACQQTGRNSTGAPRSDTCLGHGCNMDVPKEEGGEMSEQGWNHRICEKGAGSWRSMGQRGAGKGERMEMGEQMEK